MKMGVFELIVFSLFTLMFHYLFNKEVHNYGAEAVKHIEECEKSLPRDQRCGIMSYVIGTVE